MLPLLLAAPLWGAVAGPPPAEAPAISLPAEVNSQPGRLVKLTATTDGKLVRWLLASDDADLIPFPDGKTALFCAAKPGRYLVLAWTAAGELPSEAARCVVVVGDPPAPVPPTPPADPLAAEFRKLLAAEPSPDRLAHLAQLAALYREAVKFADSTDVKTAGELAARIRTAAGTLLPADALVAIRKRVAEEITRELPTDTDTALDVPTRRKAALLFARIATSLENAR